MPSAALSANKIGNVTKRNMADPIDALEEMITGALAQQHADGVIPCIKASIQRWRECWGGSDHVYIAKRSHVARQHRVLELASNGLSTGEISQRIGVSPRQVQRIKQRASSYL